MPGELIHFRHDLQVAQCTQLPYFFQAQGHQKIADGHSVSSYDPNVEIAV